MFRKFRCLLSCIQYASCHSQVCDVLEFQITELDPLPVVSTKVFEFNSSLRVFFSEILSERQSHLLQCWYKKYHIPNPFIQSKRMRRCHGNTISLRCWDGRGSTRGGRGRWRRENQQTKAKESEAKSKQRNFRNIFFPSGKRQICREFHILLSPSSSLLHYTVKASSGRLVSCAFACLLSHVAKLQSNVTISESVWHANECVAHDVEKLPSVSLNQSNGWWEWVTNKRPNPSLQSLPQ